MNLRAITLLLILMLRAGDVWSGTVSGSVHEDSGDPVEGARVQVLTESALGAVAGAATDARGQFRITGLPAGTYVLAASRIGLHPNRSAAFALADTESLFLDLSLAPSAIHLNPTVVTASRRKEKTLDAPASITVVNKTELAERAAVTPIAHVRAVPGLDVAAKGLTQSSVVARGFNSQQSSAAMSLVDYRAASLPSLRYNLFHFIPTPAEDIERIEVVRGPAAALYGPNSDRGVIHILTRSPLDAPGTSISVAGGERDVVQGSFRHATRFNEHWGFRVTAQALNGTEWPDTDPVEEANRAEAIATGADPEALRIGDRHDGNERVAGEGRVDWKPSPDVSLIASAGINRTIESIEITGVGAAQVLGWRSSYVQLRGRASKLFAQAFLNASDAGDSYFLRSGRPIVDRSRFWAVQVQHESEAFRSIRLTYGADGQWTDPRTDSTIMGRNEGDDRIRELGGYLHAEKGLGPSLQTVAALRLDDHSRFEDPVLSPRAALVWRPREDQNFRITYNRAFGTPSTEDLFADLVVDSLSGLPYAMRAEGVPETGYTYHRQGGEPSMRSPFWPDSLAYLSPDGTLLWPQIVDMVYQKSQIDLSGVPPPTSSEVGSQWRAIDPDGTIRDVSEVADIPGLRPTITNVVEVGYRGLVARRLRFGVDLYRTWVENFIGHLHSITPNVFLDPAMLAAYLRQYMSSPEQADSLAAAISGIPLGTITPEQARDPADMIFAVQNFGSVTLWGTDISLLAEINDRFSLAGTFSWVSEDLFRNSVADVALNAPGRKGTVSAAYRDRSRGRWAELRMRMAASFPVISGVYSGEVQSYSLLDLAAGLRLWRTPATTLTVTGENILDDRHREFVGAPAMGRLVLVRVGTEF